MFHISTNIIFIFGFVTGILISLFMSSRYQYLSGVTKENSYENWFKSKQLQRRYVDSDSLMYQPHKYMLEAELLFKTISILCLILVSKKGNLKAIKNTWGKGCNAIDLVDIKRERSIFPLQQNLSDCSWTRLCLSLKNVPEVYDWVLVVLDDSFVVMENLRYFIAHRNSSDKFYLGHPVKFWNTIYNVRTAGFVLSRGTIKTLQRTDCKSDVSYRNQEDFMLGHYLASQNISVLDTKDNQGLSVFSPYSINKLLFRKENEVVKYIYPFKCCSKYLITFNGIEGDKMYKYYYLINSLLLFTSGSFGNKRANRTSDEKVWQSFVKNQNLSLNISNEKYYSAWENFIGSTDTFLNKIRKEDYED